MNLLKAYMPCPFESAPAKCATWAGPPGQRPAAEGRPSAMVMKFAGRSSSLDRRGTGPALRQAALEFGKELPVSEVLERAGRSPVRHVHRVPGLVPFELLG